MTKRRDCVGAFRNLVDIGLKRASAFCRDTNHEVQTLQRVQAFLLALAADVPPPPNFFGRSFFATANINHGFSLYSRPVTHFHAYPAGAR